ILAFEQGSEVVVDDRGDRIAVPGETEAGGAIFRRDLDPDPLPFSRRHRRLARILRHRRRGTEGPDPPRAARGRRRWSWLLGTSILHRLDRLDLHAVPPMCGKFVALSVHRCAPAPDEGASGDRGLTTD